MRSAGCAPSPVSAHRRASQHTAFHNRWLCIIGQSGRSSPFQLRSAMRRLPAVRSTEAVNGSFPIRRTHTLCPIQPFRPSMTERQEINYSRRSRRLLTGNFSARTDVRPVYQLAPKWALLLGHWITTYINEPIDGFRVLDFCSFYGKVCE